MGIFEPAEHLSAKSQTLWRQIVPRRAKSAERLALLLVGLEALDRADAARVAVQAEGMTVKTERSGVTHVHPLVKVEKESRMLFSRIWGQMHLGFSPEVDGRIDRTLAYEDLTAASNH